MKLYHYSVDSYRGDKSLINDFANHFQFAEPFLLALREGMEVFKASYFSCMYLSRELRDLKLRKRENYKKDAVEALFEYVRQTEFEKDSCSRLNCVYYCETQEEAICYVLDDCIDCGDFKKEQVKILEVEVKENRVFRYDQVFYNEAMEVIQKNQFDSVCDLARAYFSRKQTSEPIFEILCDSENQVLRTLDY